ncbi:plectin-like [Crotalus adamanteus]|uniref:Plectin-like n=1 Tax=Crotalus adamanteus TaxID=8729 RepID=A0AAW1BLF6_CROAD
MSARWKEKPPMAEENSSGSSGSPTPGDTLPWNLPKHQRSKRTKAAAGGNGSVLDPAERAVLRIAGRRGLTSAEGDVGSGCRLWWHLLALATLRIGLAGRAQALGCGGPGYLVNVGMDWAPCTAVPMPCPTG